MQAPNEIVVVGAGPTGLLLAGDLAAAGVPCTVLERRSSEANLTRAFGVHARTLEELDTRGLADELVATGTKVERLMLFGKVAIDLGRLPSRFPYLLITPQYNTERLLEKRARSLGVTFVTGATVTGVEQDDDGVDVSVTYEDGTATSRRAAYVVGADGVGSTVRSAIGMPYPGQSVLRSIMLADVRLSETPPDTLYVNAGRDGFTFIAPFGDGWFRVFAWDRNNEQPDDAPLDLEQVRRVAEHALGSDYGMHDARWLSRFHSDERQAPHYRVGRVFLAGDAAHCHSPAGGQGMNTGMQDAANLGWKLAAVMNGWGGDTLLDSYDAERHPVGHMVLRSSGALIRAATLHPWVERMARNLLGGAAMRVGPIVRKAAGNVAGVDIEYPAPRDAHPSVGKRAGDVPLAEAPGRLYEALRDGGFVLLAARAPQLDGWRRRVTLARPNDPAMPVTLVRPDGYVAWATEETDSQRRDAAVRAALTQWCGPPE